MEQKPPKPSSTDAQSTSQSQRETAKKATISQERRKLMLYGAIRQFQTSDYAQVQSGFEPDSMFDEYQTTFLLKSKRIEYVYEKQRKNEEKLAKLNIDVNSPTALSISERSEMELINELKFWTVKYMNMSTVMGANIGLFSYRFLHLSLHWYIAGPLAFCTFFVSRNIYMRNAMDRIYYASHDTFVKYKQHFDAIKKQKQMQEQSRKLSDYGNSADDNNKISKEDLAKQEIQRIRRQSLIMEHQKKLEFEDTKNEKAQLLKDFIHDIHGKWINESDFSEKSFKAVQDQCQGDKTHEAYLLKEVDRKQESERYYKQFAQLYIQLYYEPLDEDYEEMKYFTQEYDKKMVDLLESKSLGQSSSGGKGLSELHMKDREFK